MIPFRPPNEKTRLEDEWRNCIGPLHLFPNSTPSPITTGCPCFSISTAAVNSLPETTEHPIEGVDDLYCIAKIFTCEERCKGLSLPYEKPCVIDCMEFCEIQAMNLQT
ncbi:180_t:CDS:2 [Funneliformis mosseae]|uniref:180_t:CDS:1 n=1 Tax=Funneliformis mosseae TaxID=27381 RepID=A0A9N8VWF9_FUNMO|nr:180_t:CDS:2 [Funneliformis mosseae]